MKPVLIIAIAMMTFAGCKSSESIANAQKINFTPEQAQNITASNQFGLALFKEINSNSKSDENIFISPLSIHTALGMAWNGAGTSTKSQMASVMYLPDASEQQINESFSKISGQILASDPKVKMDIANSIWYRKGYKVKKEFLSLNKKYFKADINEIVFTDPNSKTIMNNWVAQKTNNKITQIVDEITSDHVMFLINAVYFKGMWTNEFNPENTHKRPFFMADGSKKDIMTMEMTHRFPYSERRGYKVAELPYGDGNFSMVILLPDQEMAIDVLIQILTSEEWNEINTDLAYTPEINLHLPRFKFAYDIELKSSLINLGMNHPFIPGLADFSGISDAGIYISRVKHKSFVEVNEEGTEAAAVTSIETRETAIRPNPLTFHVNRPFVFALKEKTTNTILFIGKVMDPEKE